MIAELLEEPLGPLVLALSLLLLVFMLLLGVVAWATRPSRRRPKPCSKCGAKPWQWCTECFVKHRRPT